MSGLSDHILHITQHNAPMFASGAGQRDQDQHGSDLTHARSLRDAETGAGRTVTAQPERKPMTTDIETPEAIDTDIDLLSEARTYITLRNELHERGDRLAKALATARLIGKTLVIGVDDSFYELARNYSATGGELPLRVVPVELLKS